MEPFVNENIPGGNEDIQSEQPRQEAAQQDVSQPEQPVQPQSAPYSGAGAGRRESPFADSPYEMPHQQRREYSYEPSAANIHQEEPRNEKKQKRSGGVWKKVLAAVLALVIVAGSCGATAVLVNDHWENEVEQLESDFDNKLAEVQSQLEAAIAAGEKNNSVNSVAVSYDGLTPAQIYAMNVQSVVLIHSEVITFSYGQSTTGTAAGSGFIVTEDGYVVTNYHVVEGASNLSVVLYDGTTYDATLVGSDSTNDLAVLKVEAEGLQAVTIGSSEELIVGDQVVAIGNPLGELTSTMTVGYISAKDRDVTTDNTTINMIQTDAAINSGNSGGPLFNSKGEVIGITTAKYSGSSGTGATIEGIGFAIPMDDVIGMIESLMEYGYVTGAYLGVSVYTVDDATAEMYNIPLGSLVDSVNAGSCAETAGVQAKDVIIGLGEHEITSNTDLTRALRKFEAGDTTTITVWRSGQTLDLTITFDERPQTDPNATETQSSGQGQMPSSGSYEEWYEYFAPFFGEGND